MANAHNRVLLIDDDEQLVALLSMKLVQAGYMVNEATQAEEGHKLALHNEYDIIILDIVMPGQNGLEICASLRNRGILVPTLILSGKTDKEIVIRGLEAGADDYLTKPFSGDELIARIRALLRRDKKQFKSELIKRYGVKLDVLSSTAWCGDRSVSLTQKEAMLLYRLMAEAPKPVPRTALLQDVWGISSDHSSNRLDVYVRRLRTKLKQLCGSDCIQTVRGRGYHFKQV